jgi:hypothetical protein
MYKLLLEFTDNNLYFNKCMKSSRELLSVTGASIVTPGNGVSVVVPEDLKSLTHFVLREQNGWYDPEAEWLTKVVYPRKYCD